MVLFSAVVSLVKGVLVNSWIGSWLTQAPDAECFYGFRQSAWAWSPHGASGNVFPQQETQGPLLLIFWLGFRDFQRESGSTAFQVGAG